jgi:hypothetical protein
MYRYKWKITILQKDILIAKTHNKKVSSSVIKNVKGFLLGFVIE